MGIVRFCAAVTAYFLCERKRCINRVDLPNQRVECPLMTHADGQLVKHIAPPTPV